MITDIVVNNKYVLIYDGVNLKSGTLTTGQVTTPFTAEPYATAQQIVDRAVELGLTCDTEYQLSVMEHGAVLPSENMDLIKAHGPDMDIGHQIRMVQLGHLTADDVGLPESVTLPPQAQVSENPGPPE